MRFLRIFRFGFVHIGFARQEVFVELVFNVVANFHQSVFRQGYRVGTHIGNQTDGALAHIYAFVQLLGSTHGAVGGHAQFAHGFLLQGGGGERGSRIAAALFLLNFDDFGFFASQIINHTLLCRFIGQGKLLQFVTFVMGELGGKFAATFVAVQMHRPIFLLGKGLDFVFTLANQAQSRALHTTRRQAAADFFPQQR